MAPEPHQPNLGVGTIDHIGRWTYEHFTLDLWDTGCTKDGFGGERKVFAYQLYARSELVFEGSDYSPSPMWESNADMAAGDLLGFLSCRPGDVEASYFDTYTKRQLEFAEAYGEELAIWSSDLENEQEG